MAPKVDVAERKIKIYKATIKKKCKMQKMVGTYLACGKKPSRSFTPSLTINQFLEHLMLYLK